MRSGATCNRNAASYLPRHRPRPMAETTPRVLSADADGIAEAAERLRAGALVAFPTETVYGLGGDATRDAAVARIYEAKSRPEFNPLIVHLPDARRCVRWCTGRTPRRRWRSRSGPAR